MGINVAHVGEGAWPLGFFCFAELVISGLGCDFSTHSNK